MGPCTGSHTDRAQATADFARLIAANAREIVRGAWTRSPLVARYSVKTSAPA
jgi:hypothetical protein